MIGLSLISMVLTPSPTPFGDPQDVMALGTGSMDFSWLFLKMIFAMIVVIALAIVILRYVVPKLGLHRGVSRRSDLRVVDRIPLDAKKTLFILEVEGRRLLLGASDNHVGLVADLGAALADEEIDEEA